MLWWLFSVIYTFFDLPKLLIIRWSKRFHGPCRSRRPQGLHLILGSIQTHPRSGPWWMRSLRVWKANIILLISLSTGAILCQFDLDAGTGGGGEIKWQKYPKGRVCQMCRPDPWRLPQCYCRVSNLKAQRDYYKAINVVLHRTQPIRQNNSEFGKKG